MVACVEAVAQDSEVTLLRVDNRLLDEYDAARTAGYARANSSRPDTAQKIAARHLTHSNMVCVCVDTCARDCMIAHAIMTVCVLAARVYCVVCEGHR